MNSGAIVDRSISQSPKNNYLIKNINSLNSYFTRNNLPLCLSFNQKKKMIYIEEFKQYFLRNNFKIKNWMKNNLNIQFNENDKWHIKDLSKINSKLIKLKSSQSKDFLILEINKYIQRIEENELRESIFDFFQKNHEKIINYPASFTHHYYKLGFLEHIYECLNLMDKIYENYNYLNLDMDLVISGILLHDIGKIEGYDYINNKLEINSSGKDLGHLILSLKIVSEKIISAKKDKLLSIISSHHYDIKEYSVSKNPHHLKLGSFIL